MSELLSSSTNNGISFELMSGSDQSLSPDNRLTNVHSRNSSKTLKCPKCNWHYKYQETLEIHMKEKHQMLTNVDGNLNSIDENEKTCSYCLTNSVHPRLSRGEQYPCGFKPYRCDLCLYSTTTKGNLAIHMQSDKHMNNSKDFSSTTTTSSSLIISSPENSSEDQLIQSQEMKVTKETSSSIDNLTCPSTERICLEDNCTKDALNKSLPMLNESGIPSMAENCSSSSDEYRCHSCPNKTFKDFILLVNHFQDSYHQEEDEKSVGLLCWKKGCNQYFNSMLNLQKHFQEIHYSNFNEIEMKKSVFNKEKQQNNNFLSKSRERLLSIGEDVVLHYLENNSSFDENQYEIHCDLCEKKFSSLSTLKVHYEDIHSIVLSSRAIQHWIFLLQKLHSSSSSSTTTTTNHSKLKRQSSSSSSLTLNQMKKSRHENDHFDFNNGKRQRTRINDQQLQILRSYFNLNNSPTDEQIFLMSQKSQLSTKVIKHWFRNTLFKERQRNKDSPYNFSNPPSTLNQFDLDEYQKTGTIIQKSSNDHQHEQHSENSDNDLTSNDEQDLLSEDEFDDQTNSYQQQHQQQTQSMNSSSRRANRTRFSDQQLRLLQDAFESNPYPKDDDLEILSQKLKLNSRVIVVWFQNARQKARKSYENNQTDSTILNQQTQLIVKQEKDEGYSCGNCSKLFTRFAELMKHKKQCSPTSSNNLNKKSSIIKKEFISNETILEQNNSSLDPLSSYQMLVAAATALSSSSNQQQSSSSTLPNPFNRKDNFCEQCDKHFSSTNEFNEHQTLHMQALINAAAFFPLAAYHPAAAAAMTAMAAFSSQLFNNPQTHNLMSNLPPPPPPPLPSLTRKTENAKASVSSSYASDSSNELEEDESIDSNDESRKYSNGTNPKRNRTTILPEQQDYLMSKYSLESNPSRKMLEEISAEVKLKKRVVQVWFQNTRARERKGNIIKSDSISLNKKCLHCSLIFKSKFLLENHLLTKHSDIYQTKEQLNSIDFDLFPNHLNTIEDLQPLDLSKTSIQNEIQETKFENEQSINESNDSSNDDNDDNEQFKYHFNKHKILSNGHLSPTGSQQSSSNGINGQRRFRTQMTPVQIKLMKAIFLEYRTPTMPECELLGKEIDLQKRVVQVWFQNARAKEKKNPNFFKSDLPEEYQPTNDFCKLCQCKYTIQNPQRDHLFTTKHIENIRSIFSKQMTNLSSSSTTTTTTIKDDNHVKKNSINNKFESDNCSTSVLDKSSKDEQNQLMSYLNLMHLMPMGMDPFNYGLMDPNIHGTPIFMLHLPSEALEKIVTSIKSDPHLTRAQYTQDGFNLQYLTDNGHQHVDYQTIDVGYACKRCSFVWPLYESCRCHTLLCCQLSPTSLPTVIKKCDDLNEISGYIFKIEQLAYRCLLCQCSYSTINEYEKHTKDEIHLKKSRFNSTNQENDSN